MEAWLQTSDYESENLTGTGVESVLEVLRSFDWDGERRREERAMEDREHACPAGIGLVGSSGAMLHVMPRGEGRHAVSYSYTEPHQFRGREILPGSGCLLLAYP